MLSLARDLVKVRSKGDDSEIKPLTVCFWSDLMSNPAVMYGLFSPKPRRLDYDPNKVKVMGTKNGMINQINIRTVEDLDSIQEELLGMPLLLRVHAQFEQQNVPANDQKFEGDLALLVDTSHPMIRPELEEALERARRILQARGKVCIQLDFGPAIDQWLRTTYPKGCCTLGNLKPHKARLFITNYSKPTACFDCTTLWHIFFLCWTFSAPCYKAYRTCKCTDIIIRPTTPIVRRTTLPSGKVVEITRCKPRFDI
ncbi:DgyrCDS426 [Dimorphilus gyrociliatus]|uniref:DgyrCDS426 n=1 Tax=Dimorphilus gyrociliatus TaxID=2664684 RepID=A0A7I8V6B9_9ANNE|nr:DgyrCDS426 [Dimorphilus gyrociliatus]